MTAADLRGRIRKAIHELIDSGAETGVQVAAVHHGAVVADVAGGLADPATGCPVSPGTLFWAASTAKGMASTVVHVLAERGELGNDLRVAEVWPEFAATGKTRLPSGTCCATRLASQCCRRAPPRTTYATGSAYARC